NQETKQQVRSSLFPSLCSRISIFHRDEVEKRESTFVFCFWSLIRSLVFGLADHYFRLADFLFGKADFVV
ncbi:unnamed protein product, partial [Brassica oleracea var. botrytis]